MKHEAPEEYERRVLAPAREREAKRRRKAAESGLRAIDMQIASFGSREAFNAYKRERRAAKIAADIAAGKRKPREPKLDRDVKLRAQHAKRIARAKARKANPTYGMTDAELARWKVRNDPAYAINVRMRVQIRKALKGGKAGRSWESLVGYTLSDLVAHLERTMPRGYTLNDLFGGRLHIDHIVPKSEFDVTDPEQLRKCWCLSNLRPLPAGENIKKGAKRLFLV